MERDGKKNVVGRGLGREDMTLEGREVRVDTIQNTNWVVAPDFEMKVPPSEEAIHVVILARNEASVIGGTLLALLIGLGPKDQMHVVADHCSDATAHIAHEAGANVYLRQDGGPAGKGHALRWWLDETRSRAAEDDILVILDADSLVAPNFFKSIRDRMARGEKSFRPEWNPSFAPHLQSLD